MNERIQELIRDVGFTNSDLGDGRNQMLIEFAELIVRECIDCINETDKHYIFTAQDAGVIGAAHNRSIKTIKEHFGVEE